MIIHGWKFRNLCLFSGNSSKKNFSRTWATIFEFLPLDSALVSLKGKVKFSHEIDTRNHILCPNRRHHLKKRFHHRIKNVTEWRISGGERRLEIPPNRFNFQFSSPNDTSRFTLSPLPCVLFAEKISSRTRHQFVANWNFSYIERTRGGENVDRSERGVGEAKGCITALVEDALWGREESRAKRVCTLVEVVTANEQGGTTEVSSLAAFKKARRLPSGCTRPRQRLFPSSRAARGQGKEPSRFHGDFWSWSNAGTIFQR